MARIIKLFLLIILISTTAFSQWTENGDTLIVNTLSYDSITTRSGTWQFPPAQDYEKILMHHSLKCDPRTTRDNFDCGEWDYLTYTVVTDSSGTFDSSMVTSPNYLVRGGTPVEYFYTSTPYQYQEQETIVSTDYGSGLSNKVELEVFPENLGSYTYDATESNLFRMLFSYDSFHVGNTIINTVDEIHAVKIKFLEDVKIKNMLKFRNPINHKTVAFKKKFILKIGNYEKINFFVLNLLILNKV